MKEIFKAGRIYTEQQTMDDAYLVVEDGRISELLDDYTGMLPVHDNTDKIIIPGIIDIHSHGCMGYSATCKDMDEVYGFTKPLPQLVSPAFSQPLRNLTVWLRLPM